MNEWSIYIALYCALLYTQSTLQSYRGSLLKPPPVCSIHLDDATAATVQRRQCAHHTPATGGEEREIEPIKWMGIIRRPWLTKASGGNLARTPGLHLYSLREVSWDFFNDHRESGPRFNVSSERRCSFDSVPHHYTGALGPTETTGWAPPAGLTNTSTNSYLVFPGGLPSRYWPGSALLSFCGQPVLGCRVIWLWAYAYIYVWAYAYIYV